MKRTSTVLSGPAQDRPSRPWWWWLGFGALAALFFAGGAVNYMAIRGYPVGSR